MKKPFAMLLACLFLLLSLLQGCGLPNQPYLKKDDQAPVALQVVRYEICPFRTYRTGSMIAAVVTTGFLLGALGAGVGYVVHRGILAERRFGETDFGKLWGQVHQRAKKGAPGVARHGHRSERHQGTLRAPGSICWRLGGRYEGGAQFEPLDRQHIII
jgi:hypothetical protein